MTPQYYWAQPVPRIAEDGLVDARRRRVDVDEQELLQTQIKSYEFYAGLIERAVGGGASARLPRWDEQRAQEYRALADQLRQRLAQVQAQQPANETSSTPADSTQSAATGGSGPTSARA